MLATDIRELEKTEITVRQFKIENPLAVSRSDFTNFEQYHAPWPAPCRASNRAERRHPPAAGPEEPASAPAPGAAVSFACSLGQAARPETGLSKQRTWTELVNFSPLKARHGVTLGADSPARKFITVMTAGAILRPALRQSCLTAIRTVSRRRPSAEIASWADPATVENSPARRTAGRGSLELHRH